LRLRKLADAAATPAEPEIIKKGSRKTEGESEARARPRARQAEKAEKSEKKEKK